MPRRARWATWALAAVIVVDVLALGADLLEIRLMDRLIDGELLEPGTLDSDDFRRGLAGLLQLLVLVAAAVFFIRWFHRAYCNLGVLRGERRYRTAWAIVSWFTPFLNLWRPKQIANDIWRGSDPSAFFVERGLSSSETPRLLRAWWAAWLLGTIVGRIALGAYSETGTAVDAGAAASSGYVTDAENIRWTAIVDLVAGSLDIVAAILAILVVRRMTARHLDRARALELLGTKEQPEEPVSSPSPA